MHRKSFLIVAAGSAGGLLVGIGMFVGWLIGHSDRGDSLLPETLLNATATHSSENFAIATGRIDEYSEGLFMLDSLTGDLQCVVMNKSTAKFASFYRTNVLEDLDVQAKKPKFLMVTGHAQFRTGGPIRPAPTVVYVVDATSGRYVAYGLPLAGQTRRAAAVGKLLVLDVQGSRSNEFND